LVTGLETRLAYPGREFCDTDAQVCKPSLSTAVGLVLMGFEKMEREGAVYNTTTPINYSKVEEEAVAVEVEAPAAQAAEPAAAEQVKEAKKKGSGFSFQKFFSQFKEDNMFTDNEA
ncbi:MAG: hypothetical protein IKU18_04050, partial [Bacteroidales bacterium]|nr:hypothetical protein [Bacteroidales bacterium]